jgi:hypothetical protein
MHKVFLQFCKYYGYKEKLLCTYKMNYVDYRCIEPSAIDTAGPWFPISNICPCDPKLSNPTGRGYTACPFGIQAEQKTISKEAHSFMPINTNNIHTVGDGVMYPSLSQLNVISPPQFQPRPLTNIGYTWRTGM